MELFATGFNAWNQLCLDSQGSSDFKSEPDDIRVFTRILTDENIEQVEPFLSYTRVKSTFGLRSAGLLPRTHEALRTRTISDSDFSTNHLFAQASNGIVVVYNKVTNSLTQHPSPPNLKTGLFPSTWSYTPPQANSIISQLVPYSTGFIALTSTGEVLTWGDERYSSCLGREVTASTPASLPSPVPSLTNLPTGKITKIAAGGTALAALTSGNDLYAWGQEPLTPPGLLSSLNLTSDPTPLDVDDWKDISDIAIGDAHILALTTDGDLFFIGDNKNGQLGLPEVNRSTDTWTKVHIDGVSPGKASITGIVAGPKGSFVIVRKNNQ